MRSPPIVDAGIVPGAIEMMDALSIKAAEQSTGAGYRLDAGAALIVELDGPARGVHRGAGAADRSVRVGAARWTCASPSPMASAI